MVRKRLYFKHTQSSDTPATVPNPKECLKTDEVPPSTGGNSDSGATKTGISKKDKRATRHQKWIKSNADSFLLVYVLIE